MFQKEERDVQEQQDVDGAEILASGPEHVLTRATPWTGKSSAEHVSARDHILRPLEPQHVALLQSMLRRLAAGELQDVLRHRVRRIARAVLDAGTAARRASRARCAGSRRSRSCPAGCACSSSRTGTRRPRAKKNSIPAPGARWSRYMSPCARSSSSSAISMFTTKPSGKITRGPAGRGLRRRCAVVRWPEASPSEQAFDSELSISSSTSSRFISLPPPPRPRSRARGG